MKCLVILKARLTDQCLRVTVPRGSTNELTSSVGCQLIPRYITSSWPRRTEWWCWRPCTTVTGHQTSDRYCHTSQNSWNRLRYTQTNWNRLRNGLYMKILQCSIECTCVWRDTTVCLSVCHTWTVTLPILSVPLITGTNDLYGVSCNMIRELLSGGEWGETIYWMVWTSGRP